MFITNLLLTKIDILFLSHLQPILEEIRNADNGAPISPQHAKKVLSLFHLYNLFANIIITLINIFSKYLT